jgi:antitoxin (DNA-binding transcriptional repressor) of toxin-antitoxin stability system
MTIVNLQEADLARLVDRVAGGEEIVIAKSGRPVAKLVRVESGPRKPGRLKGRIHIADDFGEPLPEEILRGFRGEGE